MSQEFDHEKGAALRDESMAQVEAHADDAWKLAAWDALVRSVGIALARPKAEFTTDLVWWCLNDAGAVPAREPRALGPVMKQAQRQGLISFTGRVSHTARPQAHKGMNKIWLAERLP